MLFRSWDKLNIVEYENLNDFLEKNKSNIARMFMLTTKGKKVYTDVKYQEGDYFLFGKETKGLPEDLILNHFETAVRVPMGYDIRSLNLSNTVALVAYEAARQFNFEGLEETSKYFD